MSRLLPSFARCIETVVFCSLLELENHTWLKLWQLKPTIRPSSRFLLLTWCPSGLASRKSWFETCSKWPEVTSHRLYSSTKLILCALRDLRTSRNQLAGSRRNSSFKCKESVKMIKAFWFWLPPTSPGSWIPQLGTIKTCNRIFDATNVFRAPI